MGAVTTGPGGKPVITVTGLNVNGSTTVPAKPTHLLPKDGFHDSREVALAESLGKATQEGQPLHPAALQILRDQRKAIAGVRGWVDNLEQTLNRAEAMSRGGS